MNLASIIDGHPADAAALVSQGRITTYGSLRERTDSFRSALEVLGVEAGDRVALLCGNDTYFAVALLATVGLGAVAVPLNPTSPAPELERQLAEVTPVAAVVGPMASAAWQAIHPSVTGAIGVVVATAGHDLDGAHTFDQLLDATPLRPADVSEDTLALLMFTSGTAGSSLAAMLTHGNLVANLGQIRSGGEDRLVPSDVVFGVLPLNHIMGLTVVLLLTLDVGASAVLEQRFDPVTALDTVRDRGVTVIPGAPPMWVAWSHLPAEALAPLERVRVATTGAAKLPEQVAVTLQERCGLVLREGYGLTEASPVVTTSSGIAPRAGSVGKVVPDLELRLVDPDGTDALAGDPGEIWVRGANVFQGYWNDGEATARVLTPDGWLRTGDVAVSDDDGYVFLVDRAKDLIIVSGFNVFPAEVEEIIAELAGVADVAVVGVAHPHTGEAVKAYVVPQADVHLDEEAVISHCQDHLARYKCPTKVLFVDQLPRNLSGKVLRRSLR
ncbi:MAG TPA: AMP-binding protein [Acidimicrobiales bacterium]